MLAAEYERCGKVITKLTDGSKTDYHSINEAKRKSRELQTKGLGLGQVRVIRVKPAAAPSRAGRQRKRKRTPYGRR